MGRIHQANISHVNQQSSADGPNLDRHTRPHESGRIKIKAKARDIFLSSWKGVTRGDG